MISGLDARALRAAREAAEITQSELAREIGVAGGERIWRYEHGLAQPRPDLLVRLAEALHLNPRQLVRSASDVPDIRALRLAAGLDAYEVATAIHTSLPTYRKWEQGRWRRLPDRSTIHALARAFEVPRTEVEHAFRSAQNQHQHQGRHQDRHQDRHQAVPPRADGPSANG